MHDMCGNNRAVFHKGLNPSKTAFFATLWILHTFDKAVWTIPALTAVWWPFLFLKLVSIETLWSLLSFSFSHESLDPEYMLIWHVNLQTIEIKLLQQNSRVCRIKETSLQEVRDKAWIIQHKGI